MECEGSKEMVLKTITPEATQTKKGWMPVQMKNLPDDRSMHIHRLQNATGNKVAALHALYAASLTCGIKKLM